MNALALEFTPYVLPLYPSVAILVWLAVFSYSRRKQSEAAAAFSLLVSSLAVWTICYGFELASKTLEGKIFWTQMKYFGAAPGPIFWLLFSLQHTRASFKVPFWTKVFVVLYSLVVLCVVFTNDQHHWMWTKMFMTSDIPESQVEHGWFFTFYVSISFVSIGASIVVFFWHFQRVQKAFRFQAFLLLAGGCIPALVRIPEDYFGFDILPKLDNIVFFFLASAILFAIAVFRYGFLEIVPIAQSLVLKNLTSGIFVFDRAQRLVSVNPYGLRLVGAKNENDVLFLPSFEIFKQWPDFGFKPKQTTFHEEELTLKKDGQEQWLLAQISPIENDSKVLIGHILFLMDITDRKKAEIQLKILAQSDSLTGLSNRRSFFDAASREAQRSARYNTPLSVILLDIDHFKSVNDRFGHQAGDYLLLVVSQVMKSLLRETDLLARYGGEEFIILMPGTDALGALQTAHRLCNGIRDYKLDLNGTALQITASFGVAQLENETVDQWIARADKALYQSKTSGRNRVTLYQESLV